MFLITTGCIKETYNMNKFSNKMHFSPTLAIAAVTGDITLSDIVTPNDTIVFDNDKFVRIVFKKDSVIDLRLKDYYDLSNMVSFSKGYKMGDLKLDDFQSTIPISLNTISLSFTTPGLRATFLALNNTTNLFPSFPQTDLGELPFNAFGNFQNAVFSSGTMTISVKNNLPAPLGTIKISLFNTTGHTPIGGQLTIPAIAAGATQSASLDLTGKTVTNSIVAAIVLTGSAGTSTPVLIDLNKTIDVGLSATNLKVQSGRIILPAQTITSLSGVDIVSFNPGSNVEIEKMKVTTGNIGYTLVSSSSISGSFAFTLSTTTPVVAKTITVNGPTNTTGTIPINNTDVDLSTDVTQNFNRIPINYLINVNSNGSLINFNKNDSINIKINMLNPDLDYVKGYFGQLSEQVDPDIMDTGIDKFLEHISGSYYISSPSIKLNYSNSFGIPIEVTLNASGKRNSHTVNLGLAPFTIAYPTTLTTRDVSSSFAINKANSKLDSLVSLPPAEITFSGSAKMNPTGLPTGGRNNYVFGNSRILGSIEVEVPMQFWIKNLQFSDTTDNFLKTKDNNANSSFKPEDIDSLRLNIVVENGFPLGVSLKMILYDSVKKTNIRTIDATDFLKAATVANGVVTGKTESTTTIRLSKDFFSAISSADKVIFMFSMSTTGNGANDVKIYSNYSISFTASVVGKPNINL
jgi:hypothetical protein